MGDLLCIKGQFDVAQNVIPPSGSAVLGLARGK